MVSFWWSYAVVCWSLWFFGDIFGGMAMFLWVFIGVLMTV